MIPVSKVKENKAILTSFISPIRPFPPVSWWQFAIACPCVYFDESEPYQRNRWHNRYSLSGPQGKQLLSLPLEGGRKQKKAIGEVCIAGHERWRQNHWRTIQSFYGRAPFFEYYADEIKSLFAPVDRPERLFSWCLSGIRLINGLMRIGIDFYREQGVALTRQIPNLEDLKTDKMMMSPSFDDADTYHQVFGDINGFIPNCSILDLLFCLGPQAPDWLRNHQPRFGCSQ